MAGETLMHILLNNLLTLRAQAGAGNFFVEKVTGLGIADIRTSSFIFSGRDGGLITDQLLGFRNINIQGKTGSSSRTQHQIDRNELISALPVGEVFPVYFTLFDGSTYRINCNLANLSLEYITRGYMSEFLIQLIAGDPLFYS